MTNKIDVMSLVKHWNQPCGASVNLPEIDMALTIKDHKLFTVLLRFNDHTFEIIGSMVYRRGLAYLEGNLNMLKAHVLQLRSPMEGIKEWREVVEKVIETGDLDARQKPPRSPARKIENRHES